LYKTLLSYVSFIEKLLVHLVPRSHKGSEFALKVSPGQSRINLSQELELSLPPIPPPPPSNYLNIYELEEDLKDFTNISLIEQSLINEGNEDSFGFTQDKITPGLVNLDEIVEEVHERRSKTPTQMEDNNSKSESPAGRLTKNGRWYRKSTQKLMKKIVKPAYEPKPPVGPARFIRRVKKSKSLKQLEEKTLLEFEDYKKLGLNDIYDRIEQYAIKNHRPARDDWMD